MPTAPPHSSIASGVMHQSKQALLAANAQQHSTGQYVTGDALQMQSPVTPPAPSTPSPPSSRWGSLRQAPSLLDTLQRKELVRVADESSQARMSPRPASASASAPLSSLVNT